MVKAPSKKDRKLLARIDKRPLRDRVKLAGGYKALRHSVRPLDFMPAKPKGTRS